MKRIALLALVLFVAWQLLASEETRPWDAPTPAPAPPPSVVEVADPPMLAADTSTPWNAPSTADPASIRFRHGAHVADTKDAPPADAWKRLDGDPSTTPERAIKSTRLRLDQAVAGWLAPEVPTTWQAPSTTVDGLVRRIEIRKLKRDYGTLYIATAACDLSPGQRAVLMKDYNSKVVARRLGVIGVGLAFVMVCLEAFSGYVRADEATKGYYTNSLRLASAAGVGAAGLAAWRLLA